MLRRESDIFSCHVIQIAGDFCNPALARRRILSLCILACRAATTCAFTFRILYCLHFAAGIVHRKRLSQHRPQTICLFEILCTHAVTGFRHRHRRHRTEAVRKRLEQSRSGRRAKLSLHAAAVDRYPFKNQSCGRRRNRQSAMRAQYGSAADMNRGNDDLLRRQQLHQQTDRCHVRHRVHGANLMEMDLIDFRAMYPGLRLRDALIDRKRFFFYRL